MRKYICNLEFVLAVVDDNGGSTGKYVVIKEGSIWERSEDPYRFVGGAGTVRLVGENGAWIEILEERLDVYFEEIVLGKNTMGTE